MVIFYKEIKLKQCTQFYHNCQFNPDLYILYMTLTGGDSLSQVKLLVFLWSVGASRDALSVWVVEEEGFTRIRVSI